MHTKRWYQDWLGWLIVGSIAYGLLCLIGLASDVGRPFPGFFTYNNLTLGRLEMVRNAPAWWWGVTETEPAVTDVLLQVEDTPFSNLAFLVNERPIYQQAWDVGQKTVAVVVERQGRQHTLDVPLVLFSWRYYFDFMFAPIVISATLWLLAWLLYRAATTDHTQRLAAALLSLMAIQAIGVHPSLFHHDQLLDRILVVGNITTTIGGLALGVAFYQFALRFPYLVTNRLTKAGTWSLGGLAVLATILCAVTRTMSYTTGLTPAARLLDQSYFILFIGLILIGILAVTVRMTANSIFLRNQSRQQREARILLSALLFILPAVWLLGQHLGSNTQSFSPLRLLADSRFFPLALPLAFAAISLRYHTFAGAQNWFFLALLLAGSGLLANLGTALLFWDRLLLIRETAVPPTPILFLLLCALGLIWGWQASWQGWLGRVFQWERVSYHELLTYGSRLAAAAYADERQLAQGMADALCAALGVVYAAVWLPEPADLTLTAVSGNIPETVVPHLKQPAVFPTKPLRLEQVIAEWLQPCHPDMAVILPLTISGRAAGVIGLGQRWDTAVFDDRDLEILDLIAQQSAIFLQNTRQTAQLRQTDQQLLHIQELTRQKTAQNLHDHLLPALSQLQMKLLTANQIISTQPDKAHTLLAESQKGLRENAELVRRIQKDLVIRPLEYGLSPYLQELVNQFNQDTGIATDLHLPTALDTAITNRNTREAIYAVWQQALDNIAQHAQATQVTANMTVDTDEIAFSICDNGRGSLPEEQEKARQNGRFGLRSMQIRLETIGGQFVFHSTPNQGSCIKAQIPLNGVQNSASLHSR